MASMFACIVATMVIMLGSEAGVPVAKVKGGLGGGGFSAGSCSMIGYR